MSRDRWTSASILRSGTDQPMTRAETIAEASAELQRRAATDPTLVSATLILPDGETIHLPVHHAPMGRA